MHLHLLSSYLNQEEVWTIIDEFHQAQHLAYNEKDLVIHNGQTIHRIAGMKEYVPNEYRITLQGHIVRRDGLLEAFF